MLECEKNSMQKTMSWRTDLEKDNFVDAQGLSNNTLSKKKHVNVPKKASFNKKIKLNYQNC